MKVVHGSVPYEECRKMGISPDELTDYSASVNPFDTPFRLSEIVERISFKNYPDRNNYELKKAISERYGIEQDSIVVSVGTTEIIYALAEIYKSALFFSPVYGDYIDSFNRSRKKIQIVEFNPNLILTHVEQSDAELIVIINPNNPDGRVIGLNFLKKLFERFPQRIFVVDESYIEMSEEVESLLSIYSNFPNIIILRSITKSFGLPGIRCGWATASSGTISLLTQKLLPWGIGLFESAVVIEALALYNEFKLQWKNILKEKQFLCYELASSGFSVNNFRTPFFTFEVSDSKKVTQLLFERYKINVRECSSFGLLNTIRIMPSTHANNVFLLKALDEIKRSSNG